MEIDIRYNSKVNITFHDMAKVIIRGDHNYLVKWFENNNFIGEMYLNSGTWGAYPMNDIANWRIEFWFEGELVHTYNNSIINNPILIICENSTQEFGNFVNLVREYVNKVADEYQTNPFVYFKKSELCDFSNDKFTPLRLNDKIDSFRIIYTKTF